MDKSQKEISKLEQEIARLDFWQEANRAKMISKKYEDLKKEFDQWRIFKNEIDDLSELAEAAENDENLAREINEKFTKAEKKFSKLEFQVLFSGPRDKNDAILSIHAGTGGVDAQDWAEILLRMYLRFCEIHGLEARIIDKSAGSEAGVKSVVVEIIGRYAYGWLRSENGVHRLVRISPFDAEKMRHTSFVLVEVLPELAEDKDLSAPAGIGLKDSDLKIEVMRAGGHGGQSVNTTDSAVRITHLPTGIVVKCQNERSQLQNKNNAFKILKAKLLKISEEKESEEIKKIKGDYQKAEWGNQARSYVMQPYKLVKDHRTNYETPDIDRVLNGEIDDFVENYLRYKIKK